jgi:hypothetical protein
VLTNDKIADLLEGRQVFDANDQLEISAGCKKYLLPDVSKLEGELPVSEIKNILCEHIETLSKVLGLEEDEARRHSLVILYESALRSYDATVNLDLKQTSGTKSKSIELIEEYKALCQMAHDLA